MPATTSPASLRDGSSSDGLSGDERERMNTSRDFATTEQGRTADKNGIRNARLWIGSRVFSPYHFHPLWSPPRSCHRTKPINCGNNGHGTCNHLRRVSATPREGQPLDPPSWKRYVVHLVVFTPLAPTNSGYTCTPSIVLHTPIVLFATRR
jgi:hypothetical protein